jgi:hypothetical protein
MIYTTSVFALKYVIIFFELKLMIVSDRKKIDDYSKMPKLVHSFILYSYLFVFIEIKLVNDKLFTEIQ